MADWWLTVDASHQEDAAVIIPGMREISGGFSRGACPATVPRKAGPKETWPDEGKTSARNPVRSCDEPRELPNRQDVAGPVGMHRHRGVGRVPTDAARVHL
jgi:hypothetical protein